MYIEKKSHYDPLSNLPFWERVDRYSYYNELNYVISEIENISKAFNLLLSKDYKCITDEEYFNIINQFYDITFFKQDILKILSVIDKVNYDKEFWNSKGYDMSKITEAEEIFSYIDKEFFAKGLLMQVEWVQLKYVNT